MTLLQAEPILNPSQARLLARAGLRQRSAQLHSNNLGV